MSGLEEKPQTSGALCVIPDQPRQPQTLQGLLKFCMEATKQEDAPGDSQFEPMTEERRKWLEDALKSMTVDVIKLLQKQIQILQEEVEQLDDDADITKYQEAIDVILDHIDNIDIACDFHKIGGFMVLNPCLQSKNAKIRAAGCEMLAVLCQHNPYCQQVVLDNEFIPKILHLIETDSNNDVIAKSLYALSAIVRHNNEAFAQFIHYTGPATLRHALSKADDKIITKTTFFLSSLCDSEPDFKSRLVFLDYIPSLINIISKERQQSHEFALGLLAKLVDGNAQALSECKNPRHSLQLVLQRYIEECKDKEECMEEVQHCRQILYLVFGLE